MDVLKELLDNARKLLGEMSSTQRASIVTMVITVASLFILIVWLGSIGEKKEVVPLSIKVSLEDSESYKGLLEAQGIEAKYDADNHMILVPADMRNKALIVLAQNEVLPKDSKGGFEDALEKSQFTDTRVITAERFRAALNNEVSSIIEGVNGVRSAKVIYTSAERKPLFRAPYRQRATVKVEMEMGKSLNQFLADTIISIVTYARAGLDQKDVFVTDQAGNHFKMDDETSNAKMAFKAIEANKLTSERARRGIEECVRRIIPKSEVYAWVDTKWDMSHRKVHTTEVLEGLPDRIISRKISDKQSDKPSNTVGTGPNIRRSTNMGSAGGREVLREYNRQDKDTKMTLGRKVTDLTADPVIKSQTVSVVVHLPPEPVMKADGTFETELDAEGKAVIDPNTGKPKIKMRPMPKLEGEDLLALERNVRKVAGMIDGEDKMEVQIAQVLWTPEMDANVLKEQQDFLREILNEHLMSVVMMVVLLAVLYLIYLQAKRALPTEEVDLPASADFGGMFSPMSMSDDDRAQADFEQMRDQVGDFIDEDPSKAASIVRRWMNSREGY